MIGEPDLRRVGLGWEVWLDGMEVSQFTYFQQVGGIECNPVSTELTYGLERLAMYVQGVESVFDLDYNGVQGPGRITYGDVFKRGEREFSAFNFEVADTGLLTRHFADAENECRAILARGLALPAYDQCLKASHLFNLLDARGALSVTDAPPISCASATWRKVVAKPGLPTARVAATSDEVCFSLLARPAISGFSWHHFTRFTGECRYPRRRWVPAFAEMVKRWCCARKGSQIMTSVEEVISSQIGGSPRGELLLEILSEEIPARMQQKAIGDFAYFLNGNLSAVEYRQRTYCPT